MLEEQWKPVKGYEGLYEVSNLGRVKSKRRKGDKLMKVGPSKHYKGRVFVVLRKNLKAYNKFVAHLVADAFLPNELGFRFISYKDGNPGNVCADNLKWEQQSGKNRSKETVVILASGARITVPTGKAAAQILGIRPIELPGLIKLAGKFPNMLPRVERC